MRNKTVKKILAYTGFRYLLVGLGAVLIDIALYFLFIRLSLFDPSAAKRISFSAGAFWSYLNNKNFTFRVKDVDWYAPLSFTLVYITGFILNSYFHDLILHQLHNNVFSVLTATVVSVIWNYFGQKFVVFRKPPSQL
jgi:putative flippase GtrA